MTNQADPGDEDSYIACQYCPGRMRHGMCLMCGITEDVELPEAMLQGTDEISAETIEARIDRIVGELFSKVIKETNAEDD